MSYVAVAIVAENGRKGKVTRPVFETREEAAAALFASRPEANYCLTGAPPHAWTDIETHARPQDEQPPFEPTEDEIREAGSLSEAIARLHGNPPR